MTNQNKLGLLAQAQGEVDRLRPGPAGLAPWLQHNAGTDEKLHSVSADCPELNSALDRFVECLYAYDQACDAGGDEHWDVLSLLLERCDAVRDAHEELAGQRL